MKQLLLSISLMFFGFTLVHGQRTISGKVTDTSGDGLIGANVIAKEVAGLGTITDVDGNYVLKISNDVKTLLISYTGYESQEISISSSNTLNVTLSEGKLLEEVVVVGYGTQIKSQVTGNIAKVSGDAIQNAPVPSIQEALQGRAAGVFIESSNGKTGGANRMRIRGSSSISASNQPLFVIDGIPLSTESLNSTGAALNPLSDINSNDIESVEILKDASAGAIYGSRAANGVVLITTKKGKEGISKINFNLQTGFSSPTNKREFMNSDEFIEYFRHAAANSDALEGDTFWAGFVEGRFDRYSGPAGERDDNGIFRWVDQPINTNWQDQAFRTGRSLLADISAQGGTDKLKYYASGSVNRTEGMIVANGFERISSRLNLDSKVNSWIDVGLNFSLARTVIDQVAADNAFSTPLQLVALSPITPVRDEDGNLYNTPVTTYYNGLIDTEDAQRKITNFRSITNGYINFKLSEGLNWRSELGYDLYNLKENAFYGSKTEVGLPFNGFGLANYGQTQNLNTKSYLSYVTDFSDLGLNATAGIEYQKTDVDNALVEARMFPTDDLKTLASAAEVATGTSTFTEFSFLSYFSRLNFDYQNKYLLTLSGRVDGSSRFGENKRYGFFPAVSVGYVLSEEDFMKDSKVFSFLKVRASYGTTGNAGIGNFQHLGLYGSGSYNNQPGLRPTQIPNPDLGWEVTTQLDLGFDFGILKDRINGEIDYYVKNTSDLLLDVPVPGTSGFTTQTQNIGAVTNKGVELVLNSTNLTGDFKWSTSFNIAYNKNEVTSLGDQQLIDGGSSRFMNVVQVGQPLGVFYGAEYAGVDSQNGDALWFVNDPDGTAGATTNDFSAANFVVLGNPTPEIIGGLTNTFGFKGFDLAFTFQGVSGNDIHLAGDSFMACNGCWFDNQTRDQLNSWRNPGDVTNVPQARLGYSNGDQARSSRYLSDGSYLRLRSLTFGYEFPKSLIKKRGLDKLRLYVQGQNLLTFTKYIGWDPEVSTDFAVTNVISGVDFYSAPQPKTITFGLNVGF
jgi:TonB-linked SusC/RagA family outer membrane protein